MVSFPRAGTFVHFIHCSVPRTWNSANYRDAEQIMSWKEWTGAVETFCLHSAVLVQGAAGTVQTSSSGNNDKILVMGKGSGVHYS